MRTLTILISLTCSVATAFAHGPLDESLARTSGSIESAGATYAALVQRAELHRVRNEYALALADLERAEQLAPESQIWFFRGRVQLDAGQAASAEQAFRRYTAAKPDDPLGYAFRARALVAMGRNQAAVGVYSAALARAPRVQFFFEQARAQVRAGDTLAALRGLDRGRAQLGLSTPLELYAVELELSKGRVDAALLRLTRIEAHAKRKAPWQLRRGQILTRAGRVEEAREALLGGLEALQQARRSRRRTASNDKLRAEFEAALAELPEPAS